MSGVNTKTGFKSSRIEREGKMKIELGSSYTFNHKEGNVLEKYDNTKCKVISNDSGCADMYIAKMNDGRKIQVYINKLSE